MQALTCFFPTLLVIHLIARKCSREVACSAPRLALQSSGSAVAGLLLECSPQQKGQTKVESTRLVCGPWGGSSLGLLFFQPTAPRWVRANPTLGKWLWGDGQWQPV